MTLAVWGVSETTFPVSHTLMSLTSNYHTDTGISYKEVRCDNLRGHRISEGALGTDEFSLDLSYARTNSSVY